MRISASEIAEWARTGQAQRELPRLVRRLIHTAGTVTQISIPAGDSVVQPGFDGNVFSAEGDAWVPKGHSVWEVSCRADVASKANEDYEKRVAELDVNERSSRTYIALTARRWNGKNKWRKERAASADWADVRAYDADGLEQWLEQSPAVALGFAEELGLAGPGVESIGLYWSKWSSQSYPAISTSAIRTGRIEPSEALLGHLRKRLETGSSEPLSLRTDSVEEAVAFISASLLNDAILSVAAVVVTDASGWRYVDRNPQIKIAIAARPEIAESPTTRDGLILLLPYASGDMSAHFRGTAGRAEEISIRLERADHADFEKALVDLGLDENDARRLSSICGRSWTVFRRNYARNPGIRRPNWLDHPSSKILSTLCLIGGWASEREADRNFVERIAGKPYPEVEHDLVELERVDDSPIVRIGGVWKAKSALELLALFGDRITDSEFDLFFSAVHEILSTPDPQLELPDEERYAAAIHGKVRPYSGILIESLCDTLVKLAVRGPDIPSLQSRNIEQRVSSLVRALLENADLARWLSLTGVLPALAEAAPETFLRAIEQSLAMQDSPVRGVIEETSESGLFGRCWHAGLLWALETLAWAPARLARVSLILAALTETKVKGNWANTPDSALLDLFRSWFPQTGATIGQRISVLDLLIERTPDVAFSLLDRLTNLGHDVASHTHRPTWREDDAGAGQGATHSEIRQMFVAAMDRQIAMADGRADRIAKLVPKLSDLDDQRAKRVFDKIHTLTDTETSDDERIQVREALRVKIHRHRNYDDTQGPELDKRLAPFEAAYDALEPIDLVKRHGWLFASSWVEPPIRTRDDDFSGRRGIVSEWRIRASQEIYEKDGWRGFVRLAVEFSAGWQVGATIPNLGIEREAIAAWIVSDGGELARADERTSIVGAMLHSMPHDRTIELVEDVLSRVAGDWSIEKIIRFLVLAPEGRAIWAIVSKRGEDADGQYWLTCSGNMWLRENLEEFLFALNHLVEAKRPRTALAMCHLDFQHVSARLLVDIFEGILRGEEADTRVPESYYVCAGLDRIEASGEIEKERLVRLEFGLMPLLGFHGEKHAKTLYHSIMSDPNLFAELLTLIYKPHSRPETREVTESIKATAQIAWRVLHECDMQPGTDERGSVEKQAFVAFVDGAREACKEADRLEVCDITLGEVLARGPTGVDGIFPFEPARDVLDRIDLEDMRSGFRTGCFNKRGVTSRSPFEGGDQERELADYYRRQAKALQTSHPYVAGVLDELAQTYEKQGLREDLDARLRREER